MKNKVSGEIVTVLSVSECLNQTMFHRSDLDRSKVPELVSAHGKCEST